MSERSEGKECRAEPISVFYESDWTEDNNRSSRSNSIQNMPSLTTVESEIDGQTNRASTDILQTSPQERDIPPTHTFEQFKAAWNMSCPLPKKEK